MKIFNINVAILTGIIVGWSLVIYQTWLFVIEPPERILEAGTASVAPPLRLGHYGCPKCQREWGGTIDEHRTTYAWTPTGHVHFITGEDVPADLMTNFGLSAEQIKLMAQPLPIEVFVLCTNCWNALTPSERLPYYWEMIKTGAWDATNWPAIKAAVLSGK